MICLCGCAKEFEPTRPGQHYLNPQHRWKAHNRRRPARRSTPFPVAASDAYGAAQAACYHAVAESAHSPVAETSQGPQFLTPSEISELQSIDAIVCREKLLTSREVAGILGVSVETLHSWRRTKFKGAPRFVRLAGPRVRYRLRDLRDWLDRLGETVRERA